MTLIWNLPVFLSFVFHTQTTHDAIVLSSLKNDVAVSSRRRCYYAIFMAFEDPQSTYPAQDTKIQCTPDISRSLFPRYSQWTHQSSPVRARYDVSFVSAKFEQGFPLFLKRCVQYRDILDRDISRVDCNTIIMWRNILRNYDDSVVSLQSAPI